MNKSIKNKTVEEEARGDKVIEHGAVECKTMIRIAALTAMAVVATAIVGCRSASLTDDIPVVKNFDAARYMGTWHEIARLPQWFERDLDHVTATYSLEGERLRIVNRGFRDGKENVSTAVGRFAGAKDEGAFKVSFFRPFWGAYRIIWLSPEYDAALVTSDDRSSLWILAREKPMASERLVTLRDYASERGFDVEAIEYPK